MCLNEPPKLGIIYKTTNLIDGKWYIGKHEKGNPNYLGSGLLLNKAIEKYGRENFKRETLAEAEIGQPLADLELLIITQTNAVNDPNSYNIAAGGYGGNTIAGFTEEEKEAFSNKIRERWASMSEEEKEAFSKKMSDLHKGKPKSEEHKKKISENAIEYWSDEDHREAKRQEVIAFFQTEEGEAVKEILREKCPHYGEDNGFYGKTHTEETKKKISDKKKGVPNTKNIGKPCPESVKKAVSEANKGRVHQHRRSLTPEQKIEVANKYFAGTTITELCKMYNCSSSPIRSCIKKQYPNLVIWEKYNTPRVY